MIDIFALSLIHGLLLVMLWRLVQRPDLDDESAKSAAEPADR
jgi:hypothetical protein